MPALPNQPPLRGQVMQHNALLTADLRLTTLETRVFLAMLRRIRLRDPHFSDCHIPVVELQSPDGEHVPYREIQALVPRLGQLTLNVQLLEPDGRPAAVPDPRSIPFMADIYYVSKRGYLVARFNESMRPYLLDLKRNYTSADLTQLYKLKSSYAHRIYWLLRQFAAFGYRQLSLEELRRALGLQTQYVGRLDHFCARVLEPARQELTATDLPFEYETIKQGRRVTDILFSFPRTGKTPAVPAPVEDWAQAAIVAGVRADSLDLIREQLVARVYDEDYIYFVIRHQRQEYNAGRVKRLGGSIYKALTAGYILSSYQPKQPAPNPTGRAARIISPAEREKQRQRLQGELEDTRNSLGFVQTKLVGTDQQKAEIELTSKIERLTQQIEQLRD